MKLLPHSENACIWLPFPCWLPPSDQYRLAGPTLAFSSRGQLAVLILGWERSQLSVPGRIGSDHQLSSSITETSPLGPQPPLSISLRTG